MSKYPPRKNQDPVLDVVIPLIIFIGLLLAVCYADKRENAVNPKGLSSEALLHSTPNPGE